MPILPEFNIAALVLECFLFFVAAKKKNLPLLRNRLFIALLCVLSVITIADICAEYIAYNNPEHWPKALVFILNGIFINGCFALTSFYTVYCFSLADYWRNSSRRRVRITLVLLVIPFVLISALIWLSPCIPEFAVYYIDEYNVYHRGGIAYIIPHFASGCYLFTTLIIVLVYRKRIRRSIVIMMISFIMIVVATFVLQLIFPGLLIDCFGTAIGTLGFMLMVQRPEEYYDAILDVMNQNGFNVIEQEHFRRNVNHVCIGIILDDTVFLTNTFGYKHFCRLMHQVAKFLRSEFKYSRVFSINQNTFCVVLKNPTEQQLCKAQNKITARFRSKWDENSVHHKLYMRLCVVKCPESASSAEDVIDIINLVTNDERYKKPVIESSEIDLLEKKESMKIEHCVRNGLAERLFEVYYQPLYSTAEKRLIGAESLIRLRDDDGKFISPEVFIPIAEKNGTILRIGEFVLESVCATMSQKELKRLGIKKIDINLSVAQCMQETLAAQIKDIIGRFQIPVEIINLEITESASVHSPETLLKNMKELNDAGFELSMDDYGSGNSNMNYLLNYPFKMIKIDKFVVWAALKEERSRTALIHTIKMIKSLGMTVLAEGIETEEQVQWLSDAGCDYLQGFYFSKPVPWNEYIEIMRNANKDLWDAEEELEDLEVLD